MRGWVVTLAGALINLEDDMGVIVGEVVGDIRMAKRAVMVG